MTGIDDLTWGDESAWLWALLALGLVFGFIWLSQWRSARLEALARRGPLPGLLDHRGLGALWVRAALVVSAAVLLVVGLAQPRWGSHTTEVKSLGVDVVFVVDASKSMMVGDVVPTRLDAARLEIHKVLDHLKGGRAALVPFAGLAFVQTPLTTDTEVVKSYLDALRVEDMPRGGTAIGRAIKEALDALAPADQARRADEEEDAYEEQIKPFEGAKHKAIVLFTDGEDHEGEPLEAAAEAARRGIHIYTVGVGTPQGRPVLDINDEGLSVGTVKGPDGKMPLFSTLNAQLLKDIAKTTDGEYFHLGANGLGPGLLTALGKLERAEYESTFEDLGEQRYHWPVVPAFLLLAVEAWLSGRRRRRVRA
ncbi:MAG: VWA domain-containing protein [Deltaproteobacteria bacterium]|nr:MAG: VWA domain-containing protein [Deltaproteobacteria bacterium]